MGSESVQRAFPLLCGSQKWQVETRKLLQTFDAMEFEMEVQPAGSPQKTWDGQGPTGENPNDRIQLDSDPELDTPEPPSKKVKKEQKFIIKSNHSAQEMSQVGFIINFMYPLLTLV